MVRSNDREMRTIEAMVRIYCRAYHRKDLCEECGAILTYAIARIDKCRFGPEKPACKNCEVHCYSPKMRMKISTIMRFSGPRMIYRHPIMALSHFLKERQIHQQISKLTNH